MNIKMQTEALLPMNSVSCYKKWSFLTSSHGLSPRPPVPLRTQNLAAQACFCGLVSMTMNFDVQGDISYHKNKDGDFQEQKVSLSI